MTLEERIDEKIKEAFLNLEKENISKKKFKLPFGKKISKGRAKKNYVILLKINENLNVSIDIIQIKDQTIMVDKVPRLASVDYVLTYKKMPMIILPSWSVEPLSPSKHLMQTLEDGSNKKGYAILMESMKKEQLGAKKEISGIIKWIFGLGILGLIAYAFITGGI